jgi:hypothetical protein
MAFLLFFKKNVGYFEMVDYEDVVGFLQWTIRFKQNQLWDSPAAKKMRL